MNTGNIIVRIGTVPAAMRLGEAAAGTYRPEAITNEPDCTSEQHPPR
jgi:hypothetical protein